MGVRRSTVSRLCPKICGRAAISVWMEEGFSFKSEASTSMIVEGLAFLTALITWAKCAAAPSRQIIPGDHGNYGVAQLHVHDGFRHVRGSSGSSGPGLAVRVAQNPQARVHRSPAIMNVAVPWFQHS